MPNQFHKQEEQVPHNGWFIESETRSLFKLNIEFITLDSRTAGYITN